MQRQLASLPLKDVLLDDRRLALLRRRTPCTMNDNRRGRWLRGWREPLPWARVVQASPLGRPLVYPRVEAWITPRMLKAAMMMVLVEDVPQ